MRRRTTSSRWALACVAVLLQSAALLADSTPFRRGDSNADGLVDISDGVNTLGYLFLGAEAISCLDAADANDSGGLDLSDAVFTFGYLFVGGASPPDPGPMACGPDPTDGDGLACDRYEPADASARCTGFPLPFVRGITVPARSLATVKLAFQNALGDLDMTVYLPHAVHPRLAQVLAELRRDRRSGYFSSCQASSRCAGPG